MPVEKLVDKKAGITVKHFAERLEIKLLPADEEVKKMLLTVYFVIRTYLKENIIAEIWDAQPLIFDCAGDDPELEAAMKLIQLRIGQKRYAQLTTPTPETVNQVAAPD